MKAVIYARYSPGPRQTDQSIEGQVRDCRSYAEQNDITVIDVYADRHISGSDFENRREFNRMLQDAEKGQFEAIIVWKIDRFGRDREEIALNKIRLKRHGVRLLYAKENIPDGPEGIILESLMEGLAEYYVADLRQKVKRGQRESALKGLAIAGMAPYGYKIVEKRYQIEESEARIVQRIFQEYGSGATAREIADGLEVSGVRSRKGQPISKNGIYHILRNEKYIGVCFYDDIPIPIPAIVSEDDFQKAQRRFKHRSAAQFKSKETYLLSCRAYCGECGALLVGDCGTSKSGARHYYYRCAKKKKSGDAACCLRTFRKDELEDLVVKYTIEDVLQDDVIDWIADRVIEIRSHDQSADQLRDLRRDLNAVKTKIKNIVDAITEGIYTDSTKDRLVGLEDQKRELEAEIARLQIKKPEITKDHVVFWLESFRRGDVADQAFKLRLMDVFVQSVRVFNDQIIIKYNYSANITEEPAEADSPCSDKYAEMKDIGPYPNIFFDRNFFYLRIRLPA